MGRAVLIDCLPWLGMWLAAAACLWMTVRLNAGKFRFRRLLHLHRNELGSAQSLSFVLTLPLFVAVSLFIVQVSQLMIGTITVHYAAFAAARAAVVWIPAGLGSREQWTIGENSVGGLGYGPDFSAPDQIPPSYVQPTSGGLTYLLNGGGPKYDKIFRAACLACLPICPSRDLGLGPPPTPEAAATQQALKAMYQALAPGRAPSDARLANKLAYAMRYTDVEVRFYHHNSEPPLVSPQGPWGLNYSSGQGGPGFDTGPGSEEFQPGQEIGWQDPITVTVHHYLALLPGPGRLLANKVSFLQTAPDRVQRQIEQDTQEKQFPPDVYVYKLTASCTLGNEGEKSVLPYEYPLD